MVHKKASKIREWYKRNKEDVAFLEHEGLLFAGAGVMAYGIASGEIPAYMGEQLAMGITAGTALNVMKRSKEAEKIKLK
jgi:hypothetical protein